MSHGDLLCRKKHFILGGAPKSLYTLFMIRNIELMFMTENVFFNKNNKKEILLVILYLNMTLKTLLVPFQSGSPIIISGPYQNYFNQMKVPNLEFHEGLPSHEKVETLNDGKFHIIVLDDLMEQIVKSVETHTYLLNTVIIIISLLFFIPKYFAQDLVPELLT